LLFYIYIIFILEIIRGFGLLHIWHNEKRKTNSIKRNFYNK
jgi:hypothetical protein